MKKEIGFVLTLVLFLFGGVALVSWIGTSDAQARQDVTITACTAIGADTYVIRINDDRVHSPAKALETGLKILLDENPNKKVKGCVPIEQVYSNGSGAGSSTEAIIVVLE
jgi:hypothetical protein